MAGYFGDFTAGKTVRIPFNTNQGDGTPITLAGTPAISIPAGFTRDGRPIGLQLQANAFREASLLSVAHRFQQATDWHLRMPAGTSQ